MIDETKDQEPVGAQQATEASADLGDVETIAEDGGGQESEVET